jgi:hypothetical protein
MAGGTGMSAAISAAGVSAVRGQIARKGREAARTFGGQGVAHPLLVDDVDEDAQAQALLLLQAAHILRPSLLPRPRFRSLVSSAMAAPVSLTE